MHAGYCGLVKVSEDDSVLQPTRRPLDDHTDDLSPALSETASQQDGAVEPVGSPLGPAPAGMQFAQMAAGQPAAVTAGYSGDQDEAEQLLLKLESLQIAEGLSSAGTYGQKSRVAEEAFAKAVQRLEQGDVPAAVNFLKVAHIACPADKPQAQARIILLLGRCQQMTGPANSPFTPPSTAVAAKPGVFSQSVPEASHVQPSHANGFKANGSTESKPGSQDGDTQKANDAFESGLEALHR